ncbi:hypothetical protein FOA43_000327 [Brettanomyces nanus]|uniref:LicD/FKTN/FKRP nucleotidyltransferase domain-containing protein n=1 Tax=Eeniella nana TaxID=13502 RepID=A0A875RWY8_EENNA|nr:uncharacterized protein FOA43_000327 [Brettanomyces nanus]QPG73023.1 hypothetical protein FOA43_000327 [Brettanomyces nanus]
MEVMAQWEYHNPPNDIDAEDILKVLALSQKRIATLNLGYSNLPLSGYQKPGEKNTMFDPRLPAALYIAKMSQHIEEQQSDLLDVDFKLQFSWKDWTDFDKRLLPSEEYLQWHEGYPIQDCEQFVSETGFSVSPNCVDLSPSEIKHLFNPMYPRFKMTRPADPRIARDARVLIASTFLYHSFDAPERILFVDSGRDSVVSIRTTDSTNRMSLLKQMSYEYLNMDSTVSETAGISLSEQVGRLFSDLEKCKLVSEADELDEFRIIKISDEKLNQPIELPRATFDWEKDTSKLQASIDENLSQFEESCKKTPNAPECDPDKAVGIKMTHHIKDALVKYGNNKFPKHFHEAGYTPKGNDNGAHFDWRFIGSRALSEYESTSGLHKLMRSWLRMTRILGVDTWIAHGSLLGFYFNGLILNWDFDHDVQVTEESLILLGRDFNQSLVVDISPGSSDQPQLSDMGTGEFFIDVGSSIYHREKGNGNNAIDARFIDIHTGMFIDITALAITKSKPSSKSMGNNLSKEYAKFLIQNKLTTNDYGDFLSDRNNHHYSMNEISPLIPTLFEGEQVFIRQGIMNILSREYMNYKKNTGFQGHTWRTRYRSWISDEICNHLDHEGNSCSTNPEVLLDDRFQRNYISLHMKEKQILDQADHEEIRREPATIKAYPEVLRPDAVLMKIAKERLH